MAYEKPHVQTLGKTLVKMGFAVADGLDVTDAAVAMELLTAFMAAADELKEDTDAALIHMLSAALDDIGDRRVGP